MLDLFDFIFYVFWQCFLNLGFVRPSPPKPDADTFGNYPWCDITISLYIYIYIYIPWTTNAIGAQRFIHYVGGAPQTKHTSQQSILFLYVNIQQFPPQSRRRKYLDAAAVSAARDDLSDLSTRYW